MVARCVISSTAGIKLVETTSTLFCNAGPEKRRKKKGTDGISAGNSGGETSNDIMEFETKTCETAASGDLTETGMNPMAIL